MKNSKKGFAPIILLILIGVVIIAAGVYLVVNNKAEAPTVTKNEQATTTDQTAGWKTHRNEEYGFSFQYPASYGELAILVDGSLTLGKNGDVSVVVYVPKVYFNNTTDQPKTFVDLMNDYNIEGYTKTNVMVGSVQSIGVSSPQIGSIVFVPLANNKILEIDGGDLNDQRFKQLLSTFKFTK